ncbi:carbohydrate esterase family 5 protein [Cylindrobasidium torrendii FP15055 ss-10]|uniref:cutinase n=1 Tax=Cylindrobasidium torrendii FP15055 ss-10 TaxID=1314674 RepID=A0A0D7B574_9AGAR|nr:carbohydrate esterase family 5 protein [Cylindrobasidium torrendii FP15055 ss-10]
MRTFIALSSFVTLALSVVLPRATGNIYNDMQDTIDGNKDCLPAAAIFARGTFDRGNAGDWVGPNFFEALGDNVAKQGVNSDAYPADLKGYLEEGGSNAGSQALADTVQAYVAKCPNSPVIIVGWSQGALVAHKGLSLIDEATVKNVAGLITFGDPWHLFSDDTSLPIDETTFQANCITGTVFDPLCANIPDDFDPSWDDVIGYLDDLPDFAQGAAEVEAAAALVKAFPHQLKDAWSSFKDAFKNNLARVLLTPQHFVYGNNGMAADAAAWALQLPKVSEALARR